MTAIAFDTHAFIKRLTAAGMPEPQAEILAEEQARLIEDRLATRADLADARRDIVADVRRDIAEAKVDLLKWMFGALAAQTAFLSLIKFFGH